MAVPLACFGLILTINIRILKKLTYFEQIIPNIDVIYCLLYVQMWDCLKYIHNYYTCLYKNFKSCNTSARKRMLKFSRILIGQQIDSASISVSYCCCVGLGKINLMALFTTGYTVWRQRGMTGCWFRSCLLRSLVASPSTRLFATLSLSIQKVKMAASNIYYDYSGINIK